MLLLSVELMKKHATMADWEEPWGCQPSGAAVAFGPAKTHHA
jgi:hypothetical protein